LIRFKSKSVKAGKKLATQMYAINMASNKLPPCATVMLVSGKKEQNDKGTFVVLDVAAKAPSSKEQISECAKWINVVKMGGVKAHDEEIEKEDKTVTPPAATYDDADLPF